MFGRMSGDINIDDSIIILIKTTRYIQRSSTKNGFIVIALRAYNSD